ncbi:fibropellin-3-like [Anneissia japonica]|uniref:fibropellin-3-like n=1 Tax=Anneissia japonica TaxID=1529436 RepID=UPI001425689A|nr:fibropellin-3-like [Anneissia japonica]
MHGYLASITTEDELDAVLNNTDMSDNARFAIGLSRLPGLNRDDNRNWKWETGEELSSFISWGKNQPNEGESNHAGIRINNRAIFDDNANNVLNQGKKPTKGYICEYAVDRCDASPCQNGATCVMTADCQALTCTCPECWTGAICQEPIDLCATSTNCLNGATCQMLNDCNDTTCLCAGCYTGPTCSILLNPCNSFPCQNRGNCSPDTCTDYTCTCQGCFSGDNCQTYICSNFTYQNDGTFVPNLGTCKISCTGYRKTS